MVAPYQPPPNYPPPAGQGAVGTDGKAASSLVFGILGLLFALPLGLPGLIAGPIAYFLGKGAKQRIAESNGTLGGTSFANARSEEHTSELQSQSNLVCRLLLEKK